MNVLAVFIDVLNAVQDENYGIPIMTKFEEILIMTRGNIRS